MRINREYFNFCNFIRNVFGTREVNVIKRLDRLQISLIKSSLRARFLRGCLQHRLVPPHLRDISERTFFLRTERLSGRVARACFSLCTRIMRIEIRDCFSYIRHVRNNISSLSAILRRTLPNRVLNDYYNIHTRRLNHIYLTEERRLNNKFNNLLRIRDENVINSMEPIEYYYSCIPASAANRDRFLRSNVSSGNVDKFKFFKQPPDRSVAPTCDTVRMDAREYLNTRTPELLDIRDKWFVNLSSCRIPTNVVGLLQLGSGFSLPPSNLKSTTIEFIKSIENNVKRSDVQERETMRVGAVSLLRRLPGISATEIAKSYDLLRVYSETKSFVRANPEVVFTRADKGNVTVALDRNEYLERMTSLLSDASTYAVVDRDPTHRIIRDLHRLLSRWKSMSHISEQKFRLLYSSDGTLPRAYGLPKIHKPGNPLRIIISYTNTPLYQLAVFLHNIISKNIPIIESSIKNSYDLVSNLSGVCLEENYTLLSLDVISMYTNIPLDLAIPSVLRRWNDIRTSTSLPREEFISALEFVLVSTYFTFNNVIYRQTFGTPMGSPLSPIVANMVLSDLEQKALKRLIFPLPLYLRYVDDIILSAPRTSATEILSIFNAHHPRLQFTMEMSVDDEINFLDTKIRLVDRKVVFDWYHKPTFSGRYLNYQSYHPMCHKIGTIVSLVDRAFHLSHPMYHRKNFSFIIQTLIGNGYPLDLIFRTMKNRVSTLISRHNGEVNVRTPVIDDSGVSYFVVPFVRGFSESFGALVNGERVRLAYFCTNTLSAFVRAHKDRLPRSSWQNVVYRLSCDRCDASYVGQTSRRLATRLTEHRRVPRTTTSPLSVVQEHRVLTGHDFDWVNVEVLHNESNWFKRLVAECIFIKSQLNGLNVQSDYEFIGNIYNAILRRFLFMLLEPLMSASCIPLARKSIK